MASAPAPIADTPITAGGYIQLRRLAAGHSVEAVAQACSRTEIGLAAAIAAIEAAEADREILTRADLNRLSAFFSFVPGIYLQLADGLAPPPICRGCGCSCDDACNAGHGLGCAWTDASRTFCTNCRRRSIRG